MSDSNVERKVCDNAVGEAELDQALADSFPSSDPPQWTLGLGPHCDTEGGPERAVEGIVAPAAAPHADSRDVRRAVLR